jgi:hypothetical protein
MPKDRIECRQGYICELKDNVYFVYNVAFNGSDDECFSCIKLADLRAYIRCIDTLKRLHHKGCKNVKISKSMLP